MSVLWFDGLLAQTNDAGVYFLPDTDVDELLEAAAVNRFPCLRVNLHGCHARQDLLLRLAGVLALPPHVVEQWADVPQAITQGRPDGAPGMVFVLEHSEDLRAQSPEDFKQAMEALQAASAAWAAQGLPLWSFIVVDEVEFDALG
ncbi:MAG: barstar family protein [Arenimonas sp.]